MEFLKTPFLRIFAFCLAPIASLPVSAQQPDPMSSLNQQLAKLGGTMQSVGEVCGDLSAAQLNQYQQQQKAMMLERGMSEASFDDAFATGLSEAQAKWKSISESERKDICKKMTEQITNSLQ